MNNKFNIEIFDNHIIAIINDKKVLLDTGAPFSFSDGSSLEILGEKYNFPSDFFGVTIDNINNLLGTQINVFLGLDVLSKLNFLIEWSKNNIYFSSEPIKIDGVRIYPDFSYGPPLLNIRIEDKVLRVYLDTGAKISYMKSEITSCYPLVWKAKDFYPILGHFETNIYELPITLANYTFKIKVGNLPSILQRFLDMMGNPDGVLGNDVFGYFDICFNFTNKELILIKR
jgi:hypothetical protein